MARGSHRAGPAWAPRLRKELILRLYQNDARGIVDSDLIDEVGVGILARCESMIAATDASRGRAKCPGCDALIAHGVRDDEVLRCSHCPWLGTWGAYKKSYQRRQLVAGGLERFVREFARDYPRARTPQERMILIDQLLHRFHGEDTPQPTRPGAVNLIEGRMFDVFAFLNRLSAGDPHPMQERPARRAWRENAELARRVWFRDRERDTAG